MPLSFGYLHSVITQSRIKEKTLCLTAEVVIEDHKHLASEQDICFGSVAVAVYRQRSSRQQYIEQTLCLGIKTVM